MRHQKGVGVGMKYKIGDLVTIVGPANPDNMSVLEECIGWTDYMDELVGKTFTVMRELDVDLGAIPRRMLSGAAGEYVWHISWLETLQTTNLFLGE